MTKPLFRLQRGGAVSTLPRSVKPDRVSLEGRFDDIRARIARATARSGREAGDVTLVAVTKTVPVEVVSEALALGVTDLGENRVQEAEGKIAALGRTAARWHLIGHLQRNKAGRALQLFDRVHGVDDFELAEALARRAQAAGRRLSILVEVNVSGEPTKFGVAPEALPELAERIAGLDGLEFDGLMTVGAPVERPEDSRPGFERLRSLRDAASARIGRPLPQLSMGMSGDFEVAVEAGSTMVRVGSALFGPRE
jgi:pyridoxal phosphate enzyme (YggS family)